MVRKIIKWVTIIFQSILIGSLILYIYAFFKYKNNWENLDDKLRGNINTYLIIAIISFGIFVLLKVFDYFFYKEKKQKQVVLEKYIPEEYQHDEVIPSVQKVETKEEPPIPKERQATCPNCGNVVDKDAYICLSCGILLNKLEEQPQHEKVIYKEVVVKNKNTPTKSMFANLVLMVLVVLIMFVAYDYTRNNGVFFTNEMTEIEKKEYIYSLANEVLNDFESSVNNNIVRVNPNNTYFSLEDLGYASVEYNPNQSFIAISRERKYFIILKGQGKFEDYSIDATLKEELSVSSVDIKKTPETIPINDRLAIDGLFYYKNN
ncbi:MAG: zinc ribbon domain-containing protein [Bacilli bacterium]|jgi:heme/copper-type cytochrome/quinol oxidase subunit 2|nr:zinc ribbon domain-containing protein [Bacilli bacterium]